MVPQYYIIDFPDWVQVVALDAMNQLILVDQYRYPGEGWFLEFPGGSTHPDRKEDPLVAAQRELKEETGYASDDWFYVGYHYPNPALMKNKCHVFLARQCRFVGPQQLDPFEVLEVKKMGLNDFDKEIKNSIRCHSLMLATYLLAQDHLGL